MLLASSCSWQPGFPIPDGVPPPPGDPVPAINTHSVGQPADQLQDWAGQRAPGMGIPIEALEAYARNPDAGHPWRKVLAGLREREAS